MRKKLLTACNPADSPDHQAWLDLSIHATVELTSENPLHPIENAVVAGQAGQWTASSEGRQVIRLCFDKPQRIRRVVLEFIERDCERTQEFAILVGMHSDSKPLELVRQQWNFSPHGSTREFEDYEVDLIGVGTLELQLTPDLGGGPSRATLSRWNVA
jgi:hypothetical protein